MKKLSLLFCLLLSVFVYAQNPADISHNFGVYPGFENGVIGSLAKQTDGKILAGGIITSYRGVTEKYIIRLNTDGTIDATFNTGSGFNNTVSAITLQPDGKILVGGSFTSFQGNTENRIIRLNPDGTKDTTFNSGTGFSNSVNTIILQPDGKMIVGGNFTNYQGSSASRIIRLYSDGTRDTTFNMAIGFNDYVADIVLIPGGKMIVGGYFTTYQGSNAVGMVLLNSNGTRDTSFNAGSGFNSSIFTIALQSDGKFVVGGYFTSYRGITENHIIRLNADGTKDTTFNTGTGFNYDVRNIKLQSDGKILAGGNFYTYQGNQQNLLVRLNTDGSKDTTFDMAEGFYGNFVHEILLLSDGKFLVGGEFYKYQGITMNNLVRLNADCTKDITFNTCDGLDNTVQSIAVQPDGKILAGGEFNIYQGNTEKRIIRLNSDGTKDAAFNTANGFNNTVRKVVVQADGKILVGGEFTAYKGNTENYIIRLNANGTRDDTFNTGIGFNLNMVAAIALQSDGKILVGGQFTAYQGNTENRIVRLNPDGTKDTSFNTGAGFSGNVWEITIQTDGKILVGGQFDTYQGSSNKNIIRLNADGTIDATFNSGNGFDFSVRTIVVQPDGKILVGGSFSSYRGIAENGLIRLNTDGTKDTFFITANGFNSYGIETIVLQPDGKIVAAGYFTTYQGTTENRIIRLNADGSKDNTFNTAGGFSNAEGFGLMSVKTLALESDGKILAGGYFTNYQGTPAAFLIQLKGDSVLSNEDFNRENTFSLWPNPVKNNLYLIALNPAPISTVSIYNLQGKLMYKEETEITTLDVSSLSTGLYLIKIKTESGEITKKFIKE